MRHLHLRYMAYRLWRSIHHHWRERGQEQWLSVMLRMPLRRRWFLIIVGLYIDVIVMLLLRTYYQRGNNKRIFFWHKCIRGTYQVEKEYYTSSWSSCMRERQEPSIWHIFLHQEIYVLPYVCSVWSHRFSSLSLCWGYAMHIVLSWRMRSFFHCYWDHLLYR